MTRPVFPAVRILRGDGTPDLGRFQIAPGDLATLPGLVEAEQEKPAQYTFKTSPGFNEGADQAVPVRDKVPAQTIPAPLPTGERFELSAAYVDNILPVGSTGAGAFNPAPRRQLGFQAHSVLIDNYSNQWIFVPAARRWVQPFMTGIVLPLAQATEIAELTVSAPGADTLQATVFSGFLAQPVTHVWYAAMLPPQQGVRYERTASEGSVYNEGSVTAPTAGTPIVTWTTVQGGIWEIWIQVNLSGAAAAAADANNVQFSDGITPRTLLVPPQDNVPTLFGPFRMNLAEPGAVNVTAIGNATAAVVYTAQVWGRRVF